VWFRERTASSYYSGLIPISVFLATHCPLYREAGTICETGETGEDFVAIAFSVPIIDENVSSLKAPSGV
jgi:hypothetical protein